MAFDYQAFRSRYRAGTAAGIPVGCICWWWLLPVAV